MTMTLEGDAALAVKYAISLARAKSTAFDGMTDDEVLSALIEMGSNCGKEAGAA